MSRSVIEILSDPWDTVMVIRAGRRAAKAGRTLMVRGYPKQGRAILNACKDVAADMRTSVDAERKRRGR